MMSREARRALAFESAFDAPNRDRFQTMVCIWADAAASASPAKTTQAVATFTRDYEHFRRKALGVDARRVLAEAHQYSEDNDHV